MAKNFKITAKEDGKEYWISRSVAVVAIILGVKDGMIKSTLISQRGPGCPDFIGDWACTCGYLDWDETAEEGVVREVYEELGINIPKDRIFLHKIVTDPKENSRQNIVIRYVIPIPQEELEELYQTAKNNLGKSVERGGESCEVSDVKLISITDLTNFTWAFNHDDVILNTYNGWKKYTFSKVTESLVTKLDII